MKFINTVGVVAQSTQQVVTTDLIYLGLGLAFAVAIATAATFGVKALFNSAKTRQPGYVGIPAE